MSRNKFVRALVIDEMSLWKTFNHNRNIFRNEPKLSTKIYLHVLFKITNAEKQKYERQRNFRELLKVRLNTEKLMNKLTAYLTN